MTRACDLGPGDVWTPSDEVDRCECGIELESEPCLHSHCEECRDASECCLECQTCHKFSDADEYDFEADRCIDCAVAAQERAERSAGRDECWREDQGRERYYEGKYGETR